MLPQVLLNDIQTYRTELTERSRARLLLTLQTLDYALYDKRFLIVYGSLREGEYNYNRLRCIFGTEELFYVADCEVQDYAMYSVLDNYPAAIYTDQSSDIIEGQILGMSERVYKAIKDMEESAGYELYSEIASCNISKHQFRIKMDLFVATPKLEKVVEKFPKVKSGNWSDYLRETHEQKN